VVFSTSPDYSPVWYLVLLYFSLSLESLFSLTPFSSPLLVSWVGFGSPNGPLLLFFLFPSRFPFLEAGILRFPHGFFFVFLWDGIEVDGCLYWQSSVFRTFFPDRDELPVCDPVGPKLRRVPHKRFSMKSPSPGPSPCCVSSSSLFFGFPGVLFPNSSVSQRSPPKGLFSSAVPAFLPKIFSTGVPPRNHGSPPPNSFAPSRLVPLSFPAETPPRFRPCLHHPHPSPPHRLESFFVFW